MDCPFCRIIAGSLPSWRVYEDENSIAFLDKSQVTRGHTLVVPRRHAEDIWTLTENEARDVMRSAHRVASVLRDALKPLGLNVTQANGRAAWQEVFHYHVHLIPRYGDDGFLPPWRSSRPSPEQLTEVQQLLLQPLPKPGPVTVKIEGHSPDELLALPASELDALVFIGRPIVVRVGSAEVLVECHRKGRTLVVDLAHIDGGGEGALPTLTSFVGRFAQSRGFEQIDWLVRATNCAKPNEKLQRVLRRRGFEVVTLPGFGECYHKSVLVGSSHAV